MKRIMTMISLGMVLSVVPHGLAGAGEVDVLVKKLVEKGILTSSEARDILDETRLEVARQEQERQDEGDSLPSWVKNVKIKQDLRVRHQYERRRKDVEGRNRGRIRYRLSLITKLADDLKAEFGLATGGSDPRSTNQTLQNTFDSPDIRLNLAYIEYAPNNYWKIALGKHHRKSYLWAPTDLLWDGDITPEGVSAHIDMDVGREAQVWVNTGVWVLDSNDQVDQPDPFMSFLQGGAKWKGDRLDAKVAGVYYGFYGVKGVVLDHSAGSNTTEGGALKYDYDSVGGSVEIGMRSLFGGLPLSMDDRVAVFGDFIHNVDSPASDNGWSAGVKFGHHKAKKPGQWQAKYIFANLGRDAFIDAFPDSDRYGGRTDVRSHEFAVKYVLRPKMSLGIDYYRSNPIKDASNPEQLVQADVQFKF